MNKIFPKMYDCPEGRQIAGGGLYWVAYQLFFPFLVDMLCIGETQASPMAIGASVAYYLINFLVVGLIFRTYLVDSFWNARMDKKKLFSSVGLGLLVFFALEIPIFVISWITGEALLFIPFPIADSLGGIHSYYWLHTSPVIMFLCMTFVVPLAMCCLYYAVGFAMPAQERPWLGYLIVAFLAMIPAVFLVISEGYPVSLVVIKYLCTLPFHMCACWVYQRSDTIWGPILFHTTINLMCVPLWMLLFYISGMI